MSSSENLILRLNKLTIEVDLCVGNLLPAALTFKSVYTMCQFYNEYLKFKKPPP